MKILLDSLTRNDTGEKIVPPIPINVTHLYDVNHSLFVVSVKQLKYSEVASLWKGLDTELAECALTEDGEPDVTFAVRMVNPALEGKIITSSIPEFPGILSLLTERSLLRSVRAPLWDNRPYSERTHGPGKRKKKRRKGK